MWNTRAGRELPWKYSRTSGDLKRTSCDSCRRKWWQCERRSWLHCSHWTRCERPTRRRRWEPRWANDRRKPRVTSSISSSGSDSRVRHTCCATRQTWCAADVPHCSNVSMTTTKLICFSTTNQDRRHPNSCGWYRIVRVLWRPDERNRSVLCSRSDQLAFR